jgi:integrase
MSIDSPNQSRDALYEITPEDAVGRYLNHRQSSLQDATIETHRASLSFFLQWCDQNEIEYVCELDGLDLDDYYNWRRHEATQKAEGLRDRSAKSQMDILRKFIENCERLDAVRKGLSDHVPSPDPDGPRSRVPELDNERAEKILNWLEKYEYASLEHVCWALLCSTGLRLGAARSLDLSDYHPDADIPHIELHHRPDTDTPLKNQEDSERHVSLSDDLCTVLDDYIENLRPDVTDDYGRAPLLATNQGRIATSTMRTYVYKWSRPCQIGEGCPHGRDVDECEFVPKDEASKCESSMSPHSIRRGYITEELKNGVPEEVLVGRCDVSEPVLEDHYDKRSESEKMELRREQMQEARRRDDSFGESN